MSQRDASAQPAPANGAARIAYLAQGNVFLVDDAGRARRIESEFGRSVRERALRSAQNRSWRSENQGGLLSGTALWGGGGAAESSDSAKVTMCGLGNGSAPGELLYAIDTGTVSGAFRFDAEDDREIRLFHANQLRVQHLAAQRGEDAIACAMANGDGTVDVALLDGSSALPRSLTSGDSVDDAPCWVPGRSALLFQSAGVGRDGNGNRVGLGAFGIEELDLASRTLTTRIADPRYDYLSPRCAADGTLYSLRRPYRVRSGAPFWMRLLDPLLIPLRLLRALFDYLQFFSLRYSGKSLTSAGGPGQRELPLHQLVLHGNVIDAERAARRARLRGDDAPALVPASWELVCHDAGEPRVLARSVLAFDLCADGSVLVSNGSAIDRIRPGGQSERVCRAWGIEHVIALD